MSTLKTNNIQHVDLADPSIIINNDGSVNIAGTMSYEDLTNVDSVGIITGRKQLHVGTGVSIAAGGLNVTAGITTVQALQATTGTFSSTVSGTTGTFSGGLDITSNVDISDSIRHKDDTDTKIRFPGADIFSVETGGSERVRVDGSGRILKGTTSAISLANGAKTQIVGTGADDTSLAIIRQAAGGGELLFAAGTSGTNISSGNGLGFIKFLGYHTDGYDEYARIEAYADSTTGNGDAPGKLTFKTTADSAASATERLAINSAGLVSIPVAGNLQVGGAGSGLTDSKIYVANTGGDAYIQVKGADSSGTVGLKFGRNSVANRAGIDWSASTDALSFRTGGTDERIRITNQGVVGINTVGARGATLEIQDLGSTGPTLLLAGGTTTEGDIVVPDGQQISLGHWNNSDTFTERLRIDSDGQMSMGGSSSNTFAGLQRFDIYNTSTADQFHGSLIRLITKNAAGNATASYDMVKYKEGTVSHNNNESSGSINFYAGGATRLQIKSTGHIQINTGNLEFASGSGIDFSANAASGVSGTSVSTDGNKFDDYEEGDWQPVLNFGGGTTGITYAARDGAYTKVGRQVTITFMVELSSKGSSTGDATITGLPYSVADIISNTIIEASGSASYWNNIDPDLMWLGYSAESTGSGQLSMRFQPETGASDAVDSLSNTQFTNTTNFRGTVTYFTST